ncbi:MAG: exodeoxyribonuclease III [Candidatus Caenarcaniphilales bacterium]|nr:exodeoxyribonuclease III [Candidatus Caenarcaniphilales bacterium]
MSLYRLYCWNVNGIRAAIKKDFWSVMNHLKPDYLAIQETKADDGIMSAGLLSNHTYQVFWHSCAIRKGYSGVATLTHIPVIEASRGFALPEFDLEGRVVTTKFEDFTILNIYFPNGGKGPERVNYKLAFYDATLAHTEKLRAEGEKVIICGDFNTAHKEIDLHDPKSNEKVSGFLPEERAWLDKITSYGYIDTFRHFHPEEPNHYTWWDLKTFARERNRGWRIDYFFVAPELEPHLKKAEIHPQILGSDHCPLSLEIEI